MTAITFGCPYCGGRDVLRDAYASWSEYTQQWELHDVYDVMACNECGKTFDRDELLEKQLEFNFDL